MTGAIVGAVAAVAGIGMGAYSMSQQQGLAGQELGAQMSQLGMEQTQFFEQQGYAAQLNKLMQDPTSVAQLPGYQFQMSQGSDAVARQMAASGFLGSGNEAEALTQFGQGLAGSFYGQQANLLAGLAGFNAPAYGAGGNQAAANANTSLNNNFNNMGQLFASIGALSKMWGQNGWPGFGSPGGSPPLGSSMNPAPMPVIPDYWNYGGN